MGIDHKSFDSIITSAGKLHYAADAIKYSFLPDEQERFNKMLAIAAITMEEVGRLADEARRRLSKAIQEG